MTEKIEKVIAQVTSEHYPTKKNEPNIENPERLSSGLRKKIFRAALAKFKSMSDVYQSDGTEICSGDYLFEKHEIDGILSDFYYPVFFENGSFWVDESFNKDKSTSCLLAEWHEPKVKGNIFTNPELLPEGNTHLKQ